VKIKSTRNRDTEVLRPEPGELTRSMQQARNRLLQLEELIEEEMGRSNRHFACRISARPCWTYGNAGSRRPRPGPGIAIGSPAAPRHHQGAAAALSGTAWSCRRSIRGT
jgi:hypothetical protein